MPLDMNSPAYGHGGIAGQYMGDWRSQIDWDTITILVMATDSHYGLSEHQPNDWEVFCHAHSKGVRVLPTVDGGGNPANVMNVTDGASRARWISNATATMLELGLDGVIFDLEWTEDREGSLGISEMLAETAHSFHEASAHSLVGVWMDTNSSDVMLRGYDVPSIGRAVDFAALMAYGMPNCACGAASCESSSCSPDAGCRCTKPGAGSNLFYLESFVDVFRTRVPASKLFLVFPSYGVEFTCAAGTAGETCRSPGWYSAISYHAAEKLLAATAANGSLIGRSTFDAKSATQVFRWHRPAASSKAAAEMQVWWDDAHSIGVKASFAKSAGLRGVGLYQGTGAYPDNATGSMQPVYSAIRRNFLASERATQPAATPGGGRWRRLRP